MRNLRFCQQDVVELRSVRLVGDASLARSNRAEVNIPVVKTDEDSFESDLTASGSSVAQELLLSGNAALVVQVSQIT